MSTEDQQLRAVARVIEDMRASRARAPTMFSLSFEYTNHRDERATRTVCWPELRLQASTAEWYPDQWVVNAYDPSRAERRDFLVSKIENPRAELPEGSDAGR